jgi:quinol-cytochrome oxidoreductase complex cytochrome b subunit
MAQRLREDFPKRPGKTYGLMELVKGTSPMVERGPEETLFSWPHLLIMEVLVFLGTMVVLLLISTLFNAPLREIANPDLTENPAKAPWYFLNLQELLLHMNPSLAGVIIPGLVILALIALPYLDRSQQDVGIWFASRKGRTIALWTALYTTIALIGLILIDEYYPVKQFIREPELIPGWLVPLIVMGILIVVLYLGIRRWRPNTREIIIAYFTGFITTYIVLTLVGVFFRGLGMRLTLPWELPPGSIPF